MDGSVLVEPSPTALPQPAPLRVHRRCHRRGGGLALPRRPLLRLALPAEAAAERGRATPARGRAAGGGGAPGGHERGGAVRSVTARAYESLDLRFVEVDGTWQRPGRSASVPSRWTTSPTCAASATCSTAATGSVAYSGDTTPCAGPERAGPRRPMCWWWSATAGTRAGGAADGAHGRGLDPRAAGGAPRRPPGPHPPGRAGGPGVALRG